MKKLLIAGIALVMTVNVSARDKYIQATQLPAAAQSFIVANFGSLSTVRKAEVDRKEYEVKLHGGYEMEFYLDGSLKEIESDYKALPSGVLNGLPASVSAYINKKYADWKLVEVKTKSGKIEVELKKGRYEVEIKFSQSGKVLKEKIDR